MTIGSASHLTRRSLLATATMSAFGLAIPPAFAQARLDEGSIAATAQNLQPGQFLWAPEAAPEGPVIIVVSLSKQRAYVYRRSEGHTSELQSLMRISYAVFCLQKKKKQQTNHYTN